MSTKFIEKNPDLIILDLKMPGAGGIAVLEALRLKEKKMQKIGYPIIILTASDADQSDIEYLKSNAKIADFVQKPITNIPGFVKTLSKHIDNS